MRYLVVLALLIMGPQAFGQGVGTDSTSIPKFLYGGTGLLTRTNWISDERLVNEEGRASFEGGLVVIKPLTRRFWLAVGVEANTRRSTQLLDAVPTRVYESFAQLPVTAWFHRQLIQRQTNPLRTVHSLFGAGVYAAWLMEQGFATGTQRTYTVENRAFDYTKYGVLLDYSLLFLPVRSGIIAGHRVGLRANADINGLTSSSRGVRTFAQYAGIGVQYSLLLMSK